MKSIGFIGIGKMGKEMVLRLKNLGYKIVAHNKSPEPLYELAEEKIEVAFSLPELCSKLGKNKFIWFMLPKESVEIVIQKLKPLLAKDDVIVDGGDSGFVQSERRAKELELLGVNFFDVGVISTPESLKNGAMLCVGGRQELFDMYEEIFSDLAGKNNYVYAGKSGAGHFVKETYKNSQTKINKIIDKRNDILRHSPYGLDIDEIMKLDI